EMGIYEISNSTYYLKKWKIRHLDVKITFQNHIFEEEIFVKVLDGWRNESTKI
uniref:Uncharacterized protein n=2 Tax=Physcomitrium patens TaxID=3218 RepID=A0A7I3ZR49_PHYPA